MDGTDDVQLEPVRIFLQSSFRLDPEKWREFVSDKNNMAAMSKFINGPDLLHLFLHLQPASGLCAGLSPPGGVRTKVLCVSRTAPEVLTKDNSGKIVRMQEFSGEAVKGLLGLTEEVTCPLLSEAHRWAGGVAKDARKLLERQKSSAQVLEAQVEGLTFLPTPDALSHLEDLGYPHPGCSLLPQAGYHGDDSEVLGESANNNLDTGHHDDTVSDSRDRHDNVSHLHGKEQKLAVAHVLHVCEETVLEWAELVSDVLQQDWAALVLERPTPMSSEEFTFWQNRRKNLLLVQNQLASLESQRVASILQAAGSVYLTALQDLQRDVHEGLREAEDVVLNLTPVQQKLAEVLDMDFTQLRDNMAAVMEEVRLLWLRSEFYCRSGRVVVLLQEICQLFIHLSRKFLPGQEVMRVLEAEPGPILDDTRLVIQTLQALKSAYTQKQTQLELQNQNQATPTPGWNFPSHLVFFQLDAFLRRLSSIQEVHSVSMRFCHLDGAVLTGVNGAALTERVQQLHQNFLVLLRQLCCCSCDPTDPDDQNFEQNLARFWTQVSDLQSQLVSVLSSALEDCSQTSSAAKLLTMFWFLLDLAPVQNRLPPHLDRLAERVLVDLGRTELEFHRQRQKPERFFRFCPAAQARLLWNRQLRRRAEETLRSFRTVQNLCGGSASRPAVLRRSEQILDLLRNFRTGVRSTWSSGLESDCEEILSRALIRFCPPARLEVAWGSQVQAVLQELRYVSREGGVKLRPHAARLLAARDDITLTFLSLTRMVSCYNQVVGGAMEAELPLIQGQVQELTQNLSQLQSNTWMCGGAGVLQQSQQLMPLYFNIREARTNMDDIRCITQGWAELDLLHRSDSLLGVEVRDQTCRRIKADGEQLIRLTQVNRNLYQAEDSSHTWSTYLDQIDDQVQEGLLQVIRRALRFLSQNMSPQTCGPALVGVALHLQGVELVFEPTLEAGPEHFVKTVIQDVYGVASLVTRVSAHRHGNYQASLQQHPEPCALEQEATARLLQVKEEAELLRVEQARYSHLWLCDKRAAFLEFLTYGRRLAGEAEAERRPPTLGDFQREIQALLTCSSEVGRLEGAVLQGWLRVELQPFSARLLSVIEDWKHMYTRHLLEAATSSLQQATRPGADNQECSPPPLSLTNTIMLLEAAGAELPAHLAAQLQ